MVWSDEQVSNLKMLWDQGISASQIATKLGILSRNAVIGKAHRLNLDGRPSPIKGPMRPRVRRVEAAKKPLGFSERACKWPIGDPRQPDFHFCEQHVDNGLPYCHEHAAVAYQPARKHNDEARLASSLR